MEKHLIVEITNYLLREYKKSLTDERLVEAFDFVVESYKDCSIQLSDIYQKLVPYYNEECQKMEKQLAFLKDIS